MNKLLSAATITVAITLGGCVDTPEADADYGSSVRQMVQEQTYDLNAANNPPEHAPEVGDGVRLKNALDEHRKDVAKGSQEVKAPIIFEVDQ
jgi:hypothetical protein